MGTNIDLSIDKVISQLKAHIALYFIGFVGSFNLWFLTIYFVQSDFIAVHGLIITLLTTFAITLVWCSVIIVTAIKELILFFDANSEQYDLKKGKTELAFTSFARILYAQSVWLVGALLFSFLVSKIPFCDAKVFFSDNLLMILLCFQLFFVSINYFSATTSLKARYK